MSSREILVVEQQARRVVKGKVDRIRVGRPQQETPPNLPITASYRAGSLRGNFVGGVVNTTKMSFSCTAGSAQIFPEFTEVSVPAG